MHAGTGELGSGWCVQTPGKLPPSWRLQAGAGVGAAQKPGVGQKLHPGKFLPCGHLRVCWSRGQGSARMPGKLPPGWRAHAGARELGSGRRVQMPGSLGWGSMCGSRRRGLEFPPLRHDCTPLECTCGHQRRFSLCSHLHARRCQKACVPGTGVLGSQATPSL